MLDDPVEKYKETRRPRNEKNAGLNYAMEAGRENFEKDEVTQ